jgi:hypothetical protein
MSGLKLEDRIPMAAAITVVILANVVAYVLGVVIYMSILAAPLAIGAFLVCRYLLYGSALPDALVDKP